jgi:hypothetical protein
VNGRRLNSCKERRRKGLAGADFEVSLILYA